MSIQQGEAGSRRREGGGSWQVACGGALSRLAAVAAGVVAILTPNLAAGGEGGGEPAPEHVWISRVGEQKLSREEVRDTTRDGVRVISSRVKLRLPTPTRLNERLEIEKDTGRFLRCRLEVPSAAGSQVVTLEREGKQITIHVEGAGQIPDRRIPAVEPLLCLDNAVFAQYDTLGAEAVRREGKPFEFHLLVPQVLGSGPGIAAIDSSFVPGEEIRMRVGGEIRTGRKGHLRVASVLTEVWYDATTGQAYRVRVPSQSVDGILEGWEGVVGKEGGKEAAGEPAAGEAGAGGKVAGGSGPGGEGASAAFVEREVTFESPLGKVPGTLTLPASGAGPFPAAIFLHGSGPNDRDETIGPNKPFRDLARGLAAAGIATLRFDKRTYLIRQELIAAQKKGASKEEIERRIEASPANGLDGEAVTDGVAALRDLASRPEIVPDRLFVIGHSLGALAAPEVAREYSEAGAPGTIRGLVLMAGAGRPFEELLRAQIMFQATLAGSTPEAAAKTAEEKVAPIAHLREVEHPGTKMILGGTERYWKDILGRDAPAALARCRVPVLLLRGEKDCQVFAEDFDALRAALETRQGVAHEARRFPGLNHLFMPVEGRSTGAEYYLPAHVDPEVVAAIVAWIQGQA